MSKIIITDGQTDEILERIGSKDVIENDHEQDKSSYLETFSFTAFGNKRYAQYLTDKNRLIIPDEDGNWQEFVIHFTDKYREDETVFIEVIAYASYQELVGSKIIRAGRTESMAAEAHARSILSGTEVQIGEVAHTGLRTITRDNHTDPFSALKSLANTFDLELKFRIEIEGNQITRYADLVERIGEWNGRYVEFGKDLQSIRRKEETDPVTALLVIGPEREDGERLEVFVEDEDARTRWGRRGQHIVAVYEPQTEDENITEERLRTLGRTELNKRINAVISFEASIVDLEHVPGMENKKIRFGDTIRIKDTSFNPPLFVDARIYKQNRDIFNPASKRVELGDFTEYTVEQIRENWESIREELEKKIREAEERAKWRASHGSKIIAVMSVRSQKVGVDSQYNEIIDNPDLSSTLRGQLTVAKVSYDVSFDSLITASEAKEKLDNPTESDVEEVYGLLGSYESELANISELLERATESISKNYTDDHIQEVNRELDEASRRIDDAMGYLDDMSDLVDEAVRDANDAVGRVDEITDIANDALSEAQLAFDEAQSALDTAGNAELMANSASQLATDASNLASTARSDAQTALSDATKALSDVDGLETYVSDEITTINGELSRKVNQTTFNSLEGTVESHTTQISQNATAITRKADSTLVDTINDTVTSHSTIIQETAEGLDLKADKSIVDTLTGEVEAHEALLQVHAQELSSKMTTTDADAKYATQSQLTQTSNRFSSEITSVQGNLDDLEIGERNLLINSKLSYSSEGWHPRYDSRFYNEDNYFVIRKSLEGRSFIGVDSPLFNVNEGQIYTLSFLSASSSYTTSLNYIHFLYSDGQGNYKIPNVSIVGSDSDLRRYSVTFESPRNGEVSLRIAKTEQFPERVNEGFKLAEVSLKRGEKSIDWSAAPEDIEYQFSSINQTVSDITTRLGNSEGDISAIQQRADSFAARIENNEGDISTFTQIATGLQTRVENAEGDISTVTQLAGANQTRLSNAEGDINTLTTTAQSFDSRISSVEDWEFVGRNLLNNSHFEDNPAHPTHWETQYNATTERFGISRTLIRRATNNRYLGIKQKISVEEGKTYTLTINGARGTNMNTLNYVYIMHNQDPDNAGVANQKIPDIILDGGFETRFVTFSATMTSNDVDLLIAVQGDPDTSLNTYFVLDWVQLEEGDKSTGWTPSYEDLATQSQISQLANNINLRVEKGDVINQINISDENILIDANRLLINGDTHIEGTISAPDAVFEDLTVRNADLRNVNITGTLNGVGGTFTGNLTAAGGTFTGRLSAATGTFEGNMTAGSITSNTTIDVTTDLNVGDNITLSKGDLREGTKSLIFHDGLGEISSYLTRPGGAGSRAEAVLEIAGTGGVRIDAPNIALAGGNVITLSSGMSIDNSGGIARWRQSDSSYIYQNGSLVQFYEGGRRLARFDTEVDGSYRHGRLTMGAGMLKITGNPSNAQIQARNQNDSAYIQLTVSQVNETSSERFKSNIVKYEESALDIINQTVLYEFDKEGIEGRQIGVIIERETPDIFINPDRESIAPSTMTNVALKGIQELDTKVIQIDTKFEDEIRQLKTENQLLKNEIEILKEKIA